MTGWPILSITTFVPLVGALFVLLIRGEPDVVARNARSVALWTSLITFVVSLFVWINFDPSVATFQMEERADWIPAFNINYHMGVDGISVLFVILSTFLTPLCILSSYGAVNTRVKEYMIAFLVLETLMVGMFCALDMVLLRILRRRPDPDVPDHRGLGRGAPDLRRVQVLPLYAARLGADAAGDPGDVFRCRHHRRPDADDDRFPAQHADVAVAGLLRFLRGEGADVAGAYLAAGCAR